ACPLSSSWRASSSNNPTPSRLNPPTRRTSPMEIRFLGHAAFELKHEGTTLLVDPFLTGNPKGAAQADELDADAILLTHGHADHIGDTVAIAKRTGATTVA